MNAELVEALTALATRSAEALEAARAGDRVDVDLDEAWARVAELMRREDDRAARIEGADESESTGTWVTRSQDEAAAKTVCPDCGQPVGCGCP